MPTIAGRTVNHNGSRLWPTCRVVLLRESDGAVIDEVVSDDGGHFEFTVADTVTLYTVVADTPNVRAGARSGIVGV